MNLKRWLWFLTRKETVGPHAYLFPGETAWRVNPRTAETLRKLKPDVDIIVDPHCPGERVQRRWLWERPRER